MHRFMTSLARFMATLGGLVLFALIVLTCVSVTGRILGGLLHGMIESSVIGDLAQWLLDLGIGPIYGDYEVIEAGVAFCIFAFLPWTQVNAGHATVDIFTNMLPRLPNRFLITLSEVLFALVLMLIAWKLYDGMQSKIRNGETSFLIQFPVWWAYALSLFGAVMAAGTAFYTACLRVFELVSGRTIMTAGGANH